jgi:hypothetical protein
MFNMSYSVQYLMQNRTPGAANKVLVHYTKKLQGGLGTSD